MIGPFEELVLLALINAKNELTIAEIYEVLVDKMKRVSFGAIYTTIDRMGEKKFISRRKGAPLPERGGKARYYYKITNAGRAALIERQQTAAWLADSLSVVRG